MLLSEEVENFMEILVSEEFERAQVGNRYDPDYVKDLFCITLNNLKPKYVRHSIDVRINMDSDDRKIIAEEIQAAMRNAHAILANDRRKENREAG